MTQDILDWTFDPPNTPLSSWYLPIGTTCLYLITIPVLQAIMKKRKALSLHTFSICYNIFLICMSFLMGTSMAILAVIKAYRYGIFYGTICSSPLSPIQFEDPTKPLSGAFGFVIYVFYLTKYIELTDTIILILKKKPVITLHIYHHSAVIIVTWLWLEDQWNVGSWWCVVVNCTIHTFMYYYYLQTLLNPGKQVWWKEHLTKGQIVQFFTGFIIVNYWYYIRTEEQCFGGSLWAAHASHFCNTSFIFLFSRFYVKKYLGSGGSKKVADKAE